MKIRKQLGKGLGYAVAPKLNFAALNPRKAMMAKATAWAMNRVSPTRRRRARRRSTMTGLGAAAVAVPIGLWLGRKMFGGRHHQQPRLAQY